MKAAEKKSLLGVKKISGKNQKIGGKNDLIKCEAMFVKNALGQRNHLLRIYETIPMFVFIWGKWGRGLKFWPTNQSGKISKLFCVWGKGWAEISNKSIFYNSKVFRCLVWFGVFFCQKFFLEKIQSFSKSGWGGVEGNGV